MKKTKKITMLVLLLTMTQQLCSCNNSNSGNPSTINNPSTISNSSNISNSLNQDNSSLVDENETHTLSFDTDGGNEITPIVQETGTSIKIPYDPIKEGYTFIGWDKKVPETMPNSDMTFKAQWIEGTMRFSIERNGTAAITSYMGEAKELVLPNVIYNEYKLVEIRESAFLTCTSLTNIIIPSSVTTIGYSAFLSCENLNSIIIPNSVITIMGNAIQNCYSLIIYCEATSQPSSWASNWNPNDIPVYYGITKDNKIEKDGIIYVIQDDEAIVTRYAGSDTNVTIPSTIELNGMVYNVTKIGDKSFSNCTSLTSITIPSSIKAIGKYAFSKCKSLTSITIPNSVKTIEEYAFYSCSNLIIYCEAISQPDGWDLNWDSLGSSSSSVLLVYYGNKMEKDGIIYVIQNNEAIVTRYVGNDNNVTIPSTLESNGKTYEVTSIGKRAFANCNLLTSITLPNNIITIGTGAFFNCTALTTITLESGVTTIGESAFANCTSLIKITLPSGVTTIENDAFSDCTSLTSITLPKSVTTIRASFRNCTSLTIYCEAKSQPDEWYHNWNYGCKVYWNASGQITIDGLVYTYNKSNNTATIINHTSDLPEQFVIPQTITIDEKIYYVSSIDDETLPYVLVTGITADTLIKVSKGASTKINASVMPDNATIKNLAFISNDTTIATVSEDGIVTGVTAGSTTITVVSLHDTTKTAIVNVKVTENGDTPVPPVTDLTIDANGMNMSATIGTGVYVPEDYTFTINNIEFKASGSNVGLAKESYNPGLYSFNAIQIRKNVTEAITNTTAIEGMRIVTIYWLATFASENAKYFPIVQAGTDATSLTAITANEAASAPLTGVDTGIVDSNSKNVYKYTTTYTIPEGSTFFSFGSSNSTTYIQSIVLV